MFSNFYILSRSTLIVQEATKNFVKIFIANYEKLVAMTKFGEICY